MSILGRSVRVSFWTMAAVTMIAATGYSDSRNAAAKVPSIDGKKPKFTAESQILVIRRPPASVPAGKGGNEEDFVTTQTLVLRSQVITDQAAELLKKTDFGKLDGDAIRSRVRVRREEPGSNILR
ncbi:MAG TPA: hypothetical protein VHR72_06845, partial [Gemmataceae bacterium]|nr:hypothetical protein [Gemmataceae bacterium]